MKLKSLKLLIRIEKRDFNKAISTMSMISENTKDSSSIFSITSIRLRLKDYKLQMVMNSLNNWELINKLVLTLFF